MTLNERLLARMKEEMGDDPTVMMVMSLFEGNVLSIPEEELRGHIQKYCAVLESLLLDRS